MRFCEVNINDKNYELCLTTRGCVEVERKLGKNPLAIFVNASDNNLPSIGDMACIFYVALKTAHKNISEDEAFDLIDAFITDKGFKAFIELIVDIFTTSGLIDKKEVEKQKGKN